MFKFLVLLSTAVLAASAATITYSRAAPNNLLVTVTRAAGMTYGIVGFSDAASPLLYNSGVACSYGATPSCVQFTCTTAAMSSCVADAAAPYTVVSGTAELFTVNRDLTKGAIMASLPNIFSGQFEANTASPVINIALVQGSTLTATTPAPAALWTITAPTWTLATTRPTATDIAVTITPPAATTVFFGFKTSTMAPNPPAEGVICATSASAGTCTEFTCSGATCVAPATSNLTANVTNATTATVTFKQTGTITIGDTMYIAHATKETSAGPFNAAASPPLQTWLEYTAPTPAYTPVTQPDFPIVFSRPTDTTLTVKLTPATGKMVMFGWRSAAGVAFPADVIICAPNTTVTSCLDVTCTSLAACTNRATTIYSANTVDTTSATVTRLLASGVVPITATSTMQLAYVTAATPAAPVTLTPTMAQAQTWKYYTAAVPATGTTSNSLTFMPTLIAAACALLYIL